MGISTSRMLLYLTNKDYVLMYQSQSIFYPYIYYIQLPLWAKINIIILFWLVELGYWEKFDDEAIRFHYYTLLFCLKSDASMMNNFMKLKSLIELYQYIVKCWCVSDISLVIFMGEGIKRRASALYLSRLRGGGGGSLYAANNVQSGKMYKIALGKVMVSRKFVSYSFTCLWGSGCCV